VNPISAVIFLLGAIYSRLAAIAETLKRLEPLPPEEHVPRPANLQKAESTPIHKGTGSVR
jgi:hypothetical protein